jgi:hypothetical protein
MYTDEAFPIWSEGSVRDGTGIVTLDGIAGSVTGRVNGVGDVVEPVVTRETGDIVVPGVAGAAPECDQIFPPSFSVTTE